MARIALSKVAIKGASRVLDSYVRFKSSAAGASRARAGAMRRGRANRLLGNGDNEMPKFSLWLIRPRETPPLHRKF